MAYYFIYPEKDATIYSHPDRVGLNTGRDEILELLEEKSSTMEVYYPSRFLIKFKNTEIKDVLENKLSGVSTWQSNLEIFSTEHKSLHTDHIIKVHAVSQSWDEGTGRFRNNPSSSNGVTWQMRTDTGSAAPAIWATSSFATNATATLTFSDKPNEATTIALTDADGTTLTFETDNDNNGVVGSNIALDPAANSGAGMATELFNEVNGESSLAITATNPSSGVVTLTMDTSGTSGNTSITTNMNNVSGDTTSFTGGSATNSTGSSHNFTNISGGGTWWTGTNYETENSFFNEDNLDLNFNVTQIVKYFSASYYQGATYPTGIENEGFIIKKPKVTEDNPSASFGELQYFSVDTHTIYPPKLTFKWDDSVYSHSGTTLSSGDIFLSLYNNKAEFQRKSKQRFRLTTRKRYPDRTFVTSSNYLDTQYLPETSYYSIRDAETDEVIIPFDTSYTKLSADSEGMYFDLFIEGLQPERYYKLMFRSDNNEGIQIFDEDYIFKVIR